MHYRLQSAESRLSTTGRLSNEVIPFLYMPTDITAKAPNHPSMNNVDHISNLSDLVVEIETRIGHQHNSKDLLIREAFIVWYMLTEGAASQQFSEKDLLRLLKNNFEKYQQHYSNDTDYSFITGWMMQVAFWHFRTTFDESYGNQLLLKAYRNSPYNSLFKWAVRYNLGLNNREVGNLQKDIAEQFYQYYNYGPVIRNYFMGVIRG